MHPSTLLFTVLPLVAITAAGSGPDKIYGVNLGSWLVLESWMLPEEWARMGGEECGDDCSKCIASESALAAAYPNDVDQRFATHWSTWFTQDDVNKIRKANLNTVRIPLGYWIVEDIVDRKTESYPRGGLTYLINGLDMLREAGIKVILDLHAAPGVQFANQQYTGNCTSNPQFYTDYNYGRALTWAAFMTYLSHCHPSFESVFAIEAVNEPVKDATQTPGLAEYYKNFVETVRLVEWFIQTRPSKFQNTNATPTTEYLGENGWSETSSVAFAAAFPMILGHQDGLNWQADSCSSQNLEPIETVFMDALWQSNGATNPADVANGSAAYDHHSYYCFGGVTDPYPDAYTQDLCNRNDTQKGASLGNTPLVYGEWSLATEFNATDDFLFKFADAQKLKYSESSGWLFWNFKFEGTNSMSRQWSYFEGLDRGYFTTDPSQYHDPNVCAPYSMSSSNPSQWRLAPRRRLRGRALRYPQSW